MTGVIPTGNAEPDVRLQLTVVPCAGLATGAAKNTGAVGIVPGLAVTGAGLGGQVIVSVVGATSVMAKLQVALPPKLVAVQLTLVVPIGNTAPEAGVQLTVVPAGLAVGV